MPLSLSRPPSFCADVLDEHRGAVPVGRRRIEDPREVLAVGRGREPVGHRQNRDLVDRGLRDDLQRDAGRVRVDDDRVLALDLLVALDALLGVVAGLAFLDVELDAADAAVALVEHVEIVGHAAADRNAGDRKAAGAVGEQRDVDLVGRARRQRRRERERRFPGTRLFSRIAFSLLIRRLLPPVVLRRSARAARRLIRRGIAPYFRTLSTGKATPSASACRSATAARGRAARRSGRR